MNQRVAEPSTAEAGSSSNDTDPVVIGREIRKSYGSIDALTGVTVAVEPGEVFGLIGPNGAGKTTLVRALTGTTDAEGTIKLLGAPPTAVDPQAIGLLPQSFDPPARLTARELVDYYGGLYDDARETNAVLEDVGMEDDADVWYETLSGGQQRRTCVATAIVNDPAVLFLDEPTTGIDPAGRRSIHRLIERLAADGTTVFLTSHAMDEVERLADRVLLLRDGETVAVGPPADLITEHGGPPRLDISLSNPAAVDAAVTTAKPAVTQAVTGATVEPAGEAIRVLGVRPAAIGAVADALAAAGVAFESLTWTEPSLEDVYIRLTGEEYARRATADKPTQSATGERTPGSDATADSDSETDGGAVVEEGGSK